jgi:hypothetical protein
MIFTLSTIPVAGRSKAWVCGRSHAGVMDSNPAEGIDVCLLWVLSVVRYWSLCRADHSSEEYYRAWCVLWVWSQSPVRGGHDPESIPKASGKKYYLIMCNVKWIWTTNFAQSKQISIKICYKTCIFLKYPKCQVV